MYLQLQPYAQVNRIGHGHTRQPEHTRQQCPHTCSLEAISVGIDLPETVLAFSPPAHFESMSA